MIAIVTLVSKKIQVQRNVLILTNVKVGLTHAGTTADVKIYLGILFVNATMDMNHIQIIIIVEISTNVRNKMPIYVFSQVS